MRLPPCQRSDNRSGFEGHYVPGSEVFSTLSGKANGFMCRVGKTNTGGPAPFRRGRVFHLCYSHRVRGGAHQSTGRPCIQIGASITHGATRARGEPAKGGAIACQVQAFERPHDGQLWVTNLSNSSGAPPVERPAAFSVVATVNGRCAPPSKATQSPA